MQHQYRDRGLNSVEMSMTQKDLTQLLSLLSEDSVANQPLEQLVNGLYHTFNRNEFFKVGNALVVLLQQRDLLAHPAQRLAAATLLYEMYRNEQTASQTFAAVFVNLLMPDQVGAVTPEAHGTFPKMGLSERQFLAQLVCGGPNSRDMLLKKTAMQIAQSAPDSGWQPPDLASFHNAFTERQGEQSTVARSAISCIVSDPELRPLSLDAFAKPNALNSDVQRSTVEALLSGEHPHVEKSLRPEFIRLAPPLYFGEDELVWMNSEDVPEHAYVWDSSMCAANGTNKYTEIRKLMAKACVEPLVLAQQQELLEELKRDPKLVYHLGLTPHAQLPMLVKNNPLIAIEVMLRLMNSNQITEYLSVLVNMEMDLHSMEVVNRLTTAVELPKEFIHLYITNCIAACEATAERSKQGRLVRLVCVFLQSLIRNKVIDIKDMFIEVQAFCINFSRVREAASLFRLLKQLDTVPGPSGGTVTLLAPGGTPLQGSGASGAVAFDVDVAGQSDSAGVALDLDPAQIESANND